MKKMIILIISVLNIPVCIGQNMNKDETILDTAYLKCYYRYVQILDTVAMKSLSPNEMILQIGKTATKFYSYREFQRDSLFATDSPVYINNPTVNGFISLTFNPAYKEYEKGGPSLKVYKNYGKKKITFVDKIFYDNYLYEEDITVQKWQIHLDTATISGYKCQKAICNFRGRNYIAWFTREIPVNEGPYKFGGLPGLIIKIEDDKSHYSFELIKIERVQEIIFFDESTVAFQNNGDFIKTSRKDYTKAYHRFIENPDKFTALRSGALSSSLSTKNFSFHYDIIERDIK